jgi:hypothetical protein
MSVKESSCSVKVSVRTLNQRTGDGAEAELEVEQRLRFERACRNAGYEWGRESQDQAKSFGGSKAHNISPEGYSLDLNFCLRRRDSIEALTIRSDWFVCRGAIHALPTVYMMKM